MTLTQPIPIIGAGLAGLTLARCLLHSGIRTTLYEKATSSPRHNYAITLHASAYRPLLKFLDVDERTFKSKVAVDADVGGSGKIGSHVQLNGYEGMYDTSASFRANRARLEGWLGEGLDVRFGSALEKIEVVEGRPKVKFAGGNELDADFVVGADGVHSAVRKAVLPGVGLEVLPLVAFNGKKRVDRKTFEDVYAPALQVSNVVEAKQEDAVLSISVNERKEEQVSISWIFSRPPRGAADALHRPDRSNAEAQNIPEELFQEIDALSNLEQPFFEVFNAEKLRNERILHWLMRKNLTPLPELQTLLAKSRICLLGDAAHAEPIVGGNGANAAIIDGVMLAESIKASGFDGIAKRYEVRYPHWQQGYDLCEKAIPKLHASSPRNDANL